MENSDSKDCNFLCFRNCSTEKEQQEVHNNSLPPTFEKLSLKKAREEQRVMIRTHSYKRIERPIPTTERSQEEGTEAYLTHLMEKKRKVEREIEALNTDFDRYYELYANKLK